MPNIIYKLFVCQITYEVRNKELIKCFHMQSNNSFKLKYDTFTALKT